MPSACAVCALPADPRFTIGTGGGCDYPTCGGTCGDAIVAWLAFCEIAQGGTPAGFTDHGDPLACVPSWLIGGVEPTAPHTAQVRAALWVADSPRLLEAARALWAA